MKNYDKFYAVMSLIQGDKILINEVRKYPYIYDQKHEHYKDTKLKEQTWQMIGEAINVKPGDAKNRWRNLRDRYVREKKLLITEGEDVYRRHEIWPYLEDMSFLWDLIVHRKTVNSNNSLYQNGDDTILRKSKYRNNNNNNVSNNNNGSSKTGSAAELKSLPQLIPKPMQEWVNSQLSLNSSSNGTAGEDIIEVDPWSCSINEQNENGEEKDEDYHPSQSKLRRLLLEPQEDSRGNSPANGAYEFPMIHEMNGHLALQKTFAQNHPYDEDELFCLSVAASLKRFVPKTRAAIKIRIQQLLYEAEFQEDNNCSSNDTRERN